VVSLAGLSPDEFPALPARDVPFAPLDLPTVRLMIEPTLYAASSDETRYNLNGVYLGWRSWTAPSPAASRGSPAALTGVRKRALVLQELSAWPWR
jgi:hypothetical protein